MEYNIGQLHLVLQEILDYFVSICEENDLCYFLVYGTALGAYRHHGFIPWDDDLDVAMPREDYNRLITIMKDNSNFVAPYVLQNEQNESHWFLSFSKIRKTKTIFIESIAENFYKENGMYIDIFPLDYVSEKSFRQKWNDMKIKYYRHCLKFIACRKLYREKENRLRYSFDCIATFPIAILGQKRALEHLNTLRIGKDDEKVAKYISEYDDPHALNIPKDIYFPAKKMMFEGKEYCVPNKIEQYLEIVYGKSYMELPPEEDRRTHKPVRIEF